MSSRSSKSSTKSSTKSNPESMKMSSNPNDKSIMLSSVIAILYNLLVLSYIMQLEDKKCGCIKDWRHDFIKYYSIALIIWGIITILLDLSTSKSQFVSLLKNMLMIAALINIWCLYTYVGDLDKTNCMCATEKQRKMHYFLYVWRYILVGVLILSLLGVIFATFGYIPRAM